MMRDVHNGLGPNLAAHASFYATQCDPKAARNAVYQGVRFVNPGERASLRATWSACAGQWGCTLDSIPQSYPGPWDNARPCRHWLTDDGGAAPPFLRSTATSCADLANITDRVGPRVITYFEYRAIDYPDGERTAQLVASRLVEALAETGM